ncbi:MAG: hypothetical protein O2856_13770, partial [Planctomycetota bacterium]|nr:hypothetical protein [Planctomycetota bacterium]
SPGHSIHQGTTDRALVPIRSMTSRMRVDRLAYHASARLDDPCMAMDDNIEDARQTVLGDADT